jgi:selenide, water dikinase
MPVNLQRRQAVMSRSIKLGHCVCNTQQSCPCDTLKSFNVCPCAGEKLPPRSGPVPLTRFVRKAGCASKIGQADLKRILSRLPAQTDPNILLGTAAGDDAGVYRIDDAHCLVQTVDVFTPVVDDPFLFGQIAAANSLSDIYAMGGEPLTALSIIGFPIDTLDGSLFEAILQGGLQKLREAGCSLIGGHSLADEEIKCGFAVTGWLDPRQVVARDCARPGDVLVLTKPLGTGLVAFAAQIGRLAPEVLREVGESMATLNRDAAQLMVKYHAHAATDVTGFGLMGHLVEMARNSRVTVALSLSSLPVFSAAVACLENEILPGAIERNQEYAMAFVRTTGRDGDKSLPILYDPQTSGGLLISMPEEPAKKMIDELQSRGHTSSAIIGRVMEKDTARAEGGVIVTNTRLTNIIGPKIEACLIAPAAAAAPEQRAGTGELAAAEKLEVREVASPAARGEATCCGPADGGAARSPAEAPVPPLAPEEAAVRPPDQPGSVDRPGAFAPPELAGTSSVAGPAVPATALADSFMAFMKQANQPGAIDQRHKKLMAIALSVAQRCEPCLKSHVLSALEMGLTKSEIDEAAWLAVAFAGSPALMLYKETCQKLRI